jgi:hypothetical protein
MQQYHPIPYRPPSKLTIPFRKLCPAMPRQRQRGQCDFLSEVLMLFLEKKSWQGCAAKPTAWFSLLSKMACLQSVNKSTSGLDE